MDKYVCEVCDWVYDPAVGDPENGIAPGTSFADLPTIGCARSAASAKISSNLSNKKNEY